MKNPMKIDKIFYFTYTLEHSSNDTTYQKWKSICQRDIVIVVKLFEPNSGKLHKTNSFLVKTLFLCDDYVTTSIYSTSLLIIRKTNHFYGYCFENFDMSVYVRKGCSMQTHVSAKRKCWASSFQHDLILSRYLHLNCNKRFQYTQVYFGYGGSF